MPAPARLELPVAGPYSLRESGAAGRRFLPPGAPAEVGERLHLAFTDDGGSSAAVAVEQAGERLAVDYVSELPPDDVAAAVARMLSVDVDGSAWPDVGHRDPVVAELQRRFPGRRPVCFGSPFEAAVWALLSQRTSMAQASAVKERLARELGEAIEIDGRALHAFPAPERLADVDALAGVPGVKVERLRGLARGALAGELDPAELRAVPADEALSRLLDLPGIGGFSAMLVLVRGAGHPDVAPVGEPRFRRVVAEAYGIDPDADMDAIAEGWRPFRAWAAWLLRTAAA